MPIAYDRTATFVHLPRDIAFDQIIRGDRPVETLPELQSECAIWCKMNLRGHYGTQERPDTKIMRGTLDLGTSYKYFMWFEFLEDATHFKLRWF